MKNEQMCFMSELNWELGIGIGNIFQDITMPSNRRNYGVSKNLKSECTLTKNYVYYYKNSMHFFKMYAHYYKKCVNYLTQTKSVCTIIFVCDCVHKSAKVNAVCVEAQHFLQWYMYFLCKKKSHTNRVCTCCTSAQSFYQVHAIFVEVYTLLQNQGRPIQLLP